MASEQKLKTSIHNTSRKIAKEVGIHLDMEFEPNALDLIAELVWRKLLLYGSDLEAFEKHAKRSTITADDVKLLARRNESLKALIDTKLQSMQSKKSTESTAAAATNKRKRKGGSVS